MKMNHFAACVLGAFVATAAWQASAETCAVTDPSSPRNLQVIRHYDATVKPGNAAAVNVVARQPYAPVKLRQRPLRELVLDTTVPPGQREYTDKVLTPATLPQSAAQ